MSGPKSLGIREAAEAVGTSTKTLRRWSAAACPHHKAPGRNGRLTFEASEIRAWQKATGRGGDVGRPLEIERDLRGVAVPPAASPAPPTEETYPPAGGLSEEELTALRSIGLSEDVIAAANLPVHLIKLMSATARTRKELADADRKELDNRRARGETAPLVDFERFWGGQISIVHAAFTSLPGRIANAVFELETAEEVYELLEAELRRVLEQFSRELTL